VCFDRSGTQWNLVGSPISNWWRVTIRVRDHIEHFRIFLTTLGHYSIFLVFTCSLFQNVAVQFTSSTVAFRLHFRITHCHDAPFGYQESQKIHKNQCIPRFERCMNHSYCHNDHCEGTLLWEIDPCSFGQLR